MTEQEPNAQIVVETSRAFGWGSQITFRYWIDGAERPPLTKFEGDHLAGILRHVGNLIEERVRGGESKPPDESARVTMEIAERAARRARAEWEAAVIATARRGVHQAASEHGLRESQVQTLLKQSRGHDLRT